MYTSVPSNEDNISSIEQHIEQYIADAKPVDCVVTEKEVSEAVNELKNGKSDGFKGLISDHVKHAPKRLHTLLSLLLTTSIRHGYMPDDLLLATLSSIPKDPRADLCNSENYRGIALSSCLSKIFDIIVLKKHSKLLCTSDMQYAFKPKHGTTMCTMVLKEVSKYYMRNKSDVYIGMLDASKAFDRIRHDRLFEILLKRQLGLNIILPNQLLFK